PVVPTPAAPVNALEVTGTPVAGYVVGVDTSGSLVYMPVEGGTGGGGDGASAYEVAVANGFVGTEVEWLASLEGPEGPQGLQGEQGIQGEQGPPGADGADGQDLTHGTPQTINAQTGTAYTLAAADAGKVVTAANASPITVTVPASTFTTGQRV